MPEQSEAEKRRLEAARKEVQRINNENKAKEAAKRKAEAERKAAEAANKSRAKADAASKSGAHRPATPAESKPLGSGMARAAGNAFTGKGAREEAYLRSATKGGKK